MKNLATALGALSLIGVLVLFGLHFSNKSNTGTAGNAKSAEGFGSTSRIAYVNLDTLQANYDYLKNKKTEMEQRYQGMQSELKASEQQFRNDLETVQRKAQAGTLTDAEKEAANKRLSQMQESLSMREKKLTEQLETEQEEFNKELQSNLDVVIAEYNKDKKYDYILSYAKGGSIMFANKSLDITPYILKAMTERTKNMGGTEKKK